MASKRKKQAKKEKPAPIDGLSPNDLKRIHKAVRQVWSWSYPWRLAKARAMGDDGFPRCENRQCPDRGKPVPKVFVDHIDPVGVVGGPDYIARMFIPSRRLQSLCKKCHDAKTKEERKAANASAVSEPQRSEAPGLRSKRGSHTKRIDHKTCVHKPDKDGFLCLRCGLVLYDF